MNIYYELLEDLFIQSRRVQKCMVTNHVYKHFTKQFYAQQRKYNFKLNTTRERYIKMDINDHISVNPKIIILTVFSITSDKIGNNKQRKKCTSLRIVHNFEINCIINYISITSSSIQNVRRKEY